MNYVDFSFLFFNGDVVFLGLGEKECVIVGCCFIDKVRGDRVRVVIVYFFIFVIFWLGFFKIFEFVFWLKI